MNSKTGKQVADNYLENFGIQTLDEEHIEQSGILGMHWGIRRSRETLARNAGRVGGIGKKKSDAPDIPTKKKRLSELTDEELNKVISRLQKEKLYKDLVSPQGKQGNPTVQKGETIVNKMLSSFGVMLASKFASGAGDYLAKKFTTSRQVKLDAQAANEKARYVLKNEQLEKKRRDKADYKSGRMQIGDVWSKEYP